MAGSVRLEVAGPAKRVRHFHHYTDEKTLRQFPRVRNRAFFTATRPLGRLTISIAQNISLLTIILDAVWDPE
ncbi:hypothetical protein PQ455_15860 [Sphingomonas naphthae]|uniref:Uncharacterized protein n=1 Tax=Sphingomonas naphthae TaxID=1813468 RepID=A0ABY7TMM2_9SPHN|nr:hypothetical protein [Sphingomonas naphthae]WCT73089.1 hypothetical protein PQ455_15860 [Sphingomonas naphthae]